MSVLSPSINNIEISLIQEWAIKAAGDTGYVVFPFLRHGVVMIEALFSDDTQLRPDPYAYQLTASAEFLPTFSLLKYTGLLRPLSVFQIEHRIMLGDGNYISSAPLNSTPSPSGFGVKWKFCSDHEAEEACYLLMEIQRRLTPAEFLQVTTSANVDTTAAISSDTFYLFSTFSRQDIIPAGVAQFEFGATSALGNLVEYIRDTKYEAELQTVEDERGQFTSQGTIKIDFECEPMETQETELQKWPTLVGQANYSKVTFIGGLTSKSYPLTAVLSTNLGINFDYKSTEDMLDIAHGKIVATGIVTVSQFILIMRPDMALITIFEINPSNLQTQYSTWNEGSWSSTEYKMPFPAGTVKNLRVYLVGNAAITQYGLTLRKNGVDTALSVTATASAGGTLTEDLIDTFTTIEGDLISIKSVTGANGGYGSAQYQITFDFIPN